VIAELTAEVTSMPDEEDPVAAWRIELRSIEDEDDVEDERSESNADTELISAPIPFHPTCG
jgi:hypothetical protein